MTQDTQTITLRVAEAMPKDVGRGLVRLDPVDMERLGIAVGEFVLLSGQRTTIARAMPTYSEQRGQGLAQMDGIVRTNAGVGLDDRVSLKRGSAQPARSLTLTPVDGQRSPAGPSQGRYLARLLDRIPVMPGDRVRVTLLGTRSQSFAVADTAPDGPVVIGPNTTIRVGGAAAAKETGAISYEDIGGLRREVRRIREMIELPLRYPELFERLGIDPPRGVLLHGPPGCGKTLIARAVAHETSAHFITINGPEIIDKMYGASEANLRGIFEEARKKAPTIIFIDEIDSIAPKREDMSGDRQIERRVVAQLLTLMDGLDARGNIMVIAATNLPNSLDPALRRPGRFDREIGISVPDKIGRQEILDIHTRGMPLAPDVDMERLAAITHGFVGADLEALSREAAMGALRRLLPDIDFSQASIPYDKLMHLDVKMTDFSAALGEIAPSAIREVFTEVPDVGWDDVGGLAQVKQALIEAVEWPLRHGALFERSGIRPPRGIMLHGPPGTGKTLLAKALARQSEANFISVKGPQLLSMWIGESERGVREIFRKARQAAPCIVFFDEMDALAPTRGGGNDSTTTERVVSQLLTELDGIEEPKGVVVLAATNRLDRIDPALLRPGRFDLVVEIPPPDSASRREVLRIHTRRMPLAADVALDELAEQLACCAGADIEGMCRRAALVAMREHLASGKGEDELQIAQRHFQMVVTDVLSHRAARGG
ncbi:MAG: CDC48 family AAA ATPase [Chloroflexaceae bacterium]|jgi:transitional endoplasmic reticulum ATPase|nr:CDC48 family AAA ATPase [Chloroflexaceae bacterium]